MTKHALSLKIRDLSILIDAATFPVPQEWTDELAELLEQYGLLRLLETQNEPMES